MIANVTVININICNDTNSYNGSIVFGLICAGDLTGAVDICPGILFLSNFYSIIVKFYKYFR